MARVFQIAASAWAKALRPAGLGAYEELMGLEQLQPRRVRSKGWAWAASLASGQVIYPSVP